MLYQLSYLGTSRARGPGSGRFIVRPGGPVHPRFDLRLRAARPFRAYANCRTRNDVNLAVTAPGYEREDDAFSEPCAGTACRQRRQFRAQFSTLIFASRITGPHLSISDFRKAASSAGVEPFGIAPSSSNRDLTDG